jgi:hypothetical protein
LEVLKVSTFLLLAITLLTHSTGRYDFAVDPETVDYDMPRPVAGQDATEFQIARQFVQYTRVARNVYQSALMYGKLRKKTPDWAMDPKFVAHNADFSVWLRELPEDMQIAYPQDDSAPWIPSHQIANTPSQLSCTSARSCMPCPTPSMESGNNT